jgi:two-component system chemotaxis response regulator CheB
MSLWQSNAVSIRDNERVFVVGASAGGIEAIRELLLLLPRDFPAPILIVIHTPEDAPGLMSAVLQRGSQLIVANAIDGAPLQPAHVYVAPPNYHLQVEQGRMLLIKGPTENRHRPAIDPLFRSAALAYGPAVVGIVLSGYLDDGSAGLSRIKQAGGITIVQDLNDAIVSDMPRNASERVHPDYSVPIRELAPLMLRLADKPVVTPRVSDMPENAFSSKDHTGTPSVLHLP